MLRPMARLMMVNVTGKVKLIADSASVPSILIKKVSTRLKLNIISMPSIMGMVMLTRVEAMGPSVSW